MNEPDNIPGFPGYRVTRKGEVYSRRNQGGLTLSWHPLKPRLSGRKYHRHAVQLRRDLKSHSRYIHRLVLEVFVGPCPEGMEACHDNGDCFDNRLENLRWDTHFNNIQDMRKHGQIRYGSRHQNSTLTENIVAEIRQRLDSGESRKSVASAFRISLPHLHKIKHRILWPHVGVA